MKRFILSCSFLLISATMFFTGCNSSKTEKPSPQESASTSTKKEPAEEAQKAKSFPAKVATESNSERVAYKINGVPTTLNKISENNPGWDYDFKKREHNKLTELAYEAFLENFWKKEAKKNKTTVEEAENAYLTKQAEVKESEILAALEQVKNMPRFKSLDEKKRRKQVTDILMSQAKNKVKRNIIEMALVSGDLELAEAPTEPRFPVKLTSNDHLRYGPANTDTKPMGCEGNECLIQVVEYSEFQCPFCSRVMESTKKILANSNLKGKIVWTVRDFPLSFHERAEPAAVAARCAGFQDKYWPMYEELFSNQSNLSDKDFEGYAQTVGLDMDKYRKCYSSPEKAKKIISHNFNSAQKIGVTGTPAFFINGRRISGALPYEEFMRVINEELKIAQKKTKSKTKAKI